MMFSGTPSALVLLASVASLLSAPTGVLGRAVPDPCPSLCSDVAALNHQYHRLENIRRCNRPVHVSMSIAGNGATGEAITTVQACTKDVELSTETDNDQIQTGSELRVREEKKVNFQLGRLIGGIELKREEIDMIVTGVPDDLSDLISEGSPTFIELKASNTNITLGIYAGAAINTNSIRPLVREFSTRDFNGTSTAVAQFCGAKLGGNETIGIVFDGNNDNTSTELLDQLPAGGKCIDGLQSAGSWKGVSVNYK